MTSLCSHGIPEGDDCEQCQDEQGTADDQATDDDWWPEDPPTERFKDHEISREGHTISINPPSVTWDQDGYNEVAREPAEAQLQSVRILAEDDAIGLIVVNMRTRLILRGVNLPDERLRPIARQALVKRWSQDQIVEALDLELIRNPDDLPR